jgi:citrate lyase beta subunit
MRSPLFVPGSSTRMMEKVPDSSADVVIDDLQDAVHPQQKEAARPLVAAAPGNQPGAAHHDGVARQSPDEPACLRSKQSAIIAGA